MFADNPYKVSVAKAIQLGYKPVKDPQAWGGKCFQKKLGHKIVKWILFHPVLLLNKLKLHYEAELIKLGYNIEDFYNHHPDMVEMRNADNREARAQLDYEYERQENIDFLFASAGIDRDEVDDEFEQIRQLGHDPITLKRTSLL
ncbi:hypothetical protein ABH305_01940 [Acinetobacter pittii]|uniref:hypothetical protein n=1 Tax=Acinetobacter pittii TaxID=48296 RepID=UPI0032615094